MMAAFIAPELLGAGEVAATAEGVGALDAGLSIGSSLAGGAGLAGIFSNPAMALAGLPEGAAAATTLTPQALEATMANEAMQQSVRDALATQAKEAAAQTAKQASLGFEGYPGNYGNVKLFNPATDALTSGQANYLRASVAGEGPPIEPLENAAADTGTYSDVVKSKDFGSMDTAINQAVAKTPTLDPKGNWASNLLRLAQNPSMANAEEYIKQHPYASAAGAYGLYSLLQPPPKQPTPQPGLIRPYTLTRTQNPLAYAPRTGTAEKNYFTDTYTAGTPYRAPGPEYPRAADGGLVALGVGGPVEAMSAQNAIGDNTMYPQSQLQTSMYSNPMVQRPMPENVISQGIDTPVDPYTGQQKLADGGLSNLGSYSDGGRLLKGPGDGVSDSIPAVIGDRQPARLADGEFVVPARIVSELGNGSTEAGARKLYAMMERVQKARRKTVGKDRVAANTRSEKYLPA